MTGCWAPEMHIGGLTECGAKPARNFDLCPEHRVEIVGWVDTIYIRHAKLGRGAWVVTSGTPYTGLLSTANKGLGIRNFARAVAEADYEAKDKLWRAVTNRSRDHECPRCERSGVTWNERLFYRLACPNNLAAAWLRRHTKPQPPEEA